MRRLWAGADAGKAHHHCVVIDEDEILTLLADVTALATDGEVSGRRI